MRRLCFSITRSLLIVVNLIVAALACLLIYISFNAFNQDYEFADSINDNSPRLVHTYVKLICAILGLIITLLALLGLFGSIKKSKSLLATYAGVLLFMVSILFLMVIMTYTMTSSGADYKDVDKSFVNSTIVVYNYVDSSDMKTKIIDNIQKTFACCGVNSPNDWMEHSLQKIPKSCCMEPVESQLPVYKYCAESDFKIGCWKAVADHFQANMASVRVILYFLIGFGLIFLTASIFMIRSLRRSLDVV